MCETKTHQRKTEEKQTQKISDKYNSHTSENEEELASGGDAAGSTYSK